MFKRAVNLTYQFQYHRKIASHEVISDLLIKNGHQIFSKLSLSVRKNKDVSHLKNVRTKKLNDTRVSYFFSESSAHPRKNEERTKLISPYLI